MLKVALITNNLPPVIDGVGDYTDNLSNEFVKSGFKVYIICRKGISPDLINKSVDVFPIIEKWNQFGFDSAYDILLKLQPDFIIFQYVPYSYSKLGIPIGLISFVKSLTTFSKTIIFFHETYIRYKIFPVQTLLVSIIQRYILNKISKFNFTAITSIDRYRLQLNRYGLSNIHLIATPSNIGKIEIDEVECWILRKKIAPNNEKILVTFGQRDYDLLIDSFKSVVEYRNDIILLVLGQQCECVNLNSKIIFTGKLKRNELYCYLALSNLYISMDPVFNGKGGTSNKSGSLAAGLSAGLPVIGFKGDMNNELLYKIPNLVLIDYNKNSIIRTIIDHIDLKLSNDNKEFWQENLSIESNAAYYKKYILNLGND